MFKLTQYEQQIVLACKGHSKMSKDNEKLSIYEVIRHIIAKMVKIDIDYIDDDKIYYWLLKIIKKIDNQFNYNWQEDLLDSMFANDWICKHATKYTVTINEVNSKMISMLQWVPCRENGFEILELKENDEILNQI